MEQVRPRVVLRGPGDGDSMVLPMGPHRAHITRKAARTETGGHWAVGEAWQDPGFDNPPHTHDETEAFYVLKGSYTFYTDADPMEDVGPGTFVLIPPGAVLAFEVDREAASSSAYGRQRSRPRSSTTERMTALVSDTAQTCLWSAVCSESTGHSSQFYAAPDTVLSDLAAVGAPADLLHADRRCTGV